MSCDECTELLRMALNEGGFPEMAQRLEYTQRCSLTCSNTGRADDVSWRDLTPDHL